MKTKILLVLTVVLFSSSCSKDDESNQTDTLTICEEENNGESTAFASLVDEANFDGLDENVVNLGSFNFTANTDFTFVGQVYPIDLKSYGRIWDFGPDDNNFRFHQNLDATARVALGSFDHVLNVEDFWEINTWINVVIQYSSETQELHLYKNGELVGTEDDVIISPGQRDNLIIGASNWGNNFPGSSEPNSEMKTRNFRFYFAKLSTECIAELLSE